MCPTDDEAVVPRKVDKQSLDYLWRSGTAGGVAGCAVSTNKSHAFPLRGCGLIADHMTARPKPSSRRLTGSRSSSRRGIRSSSSTPGPGSVPSPL